MVNKNLRSILSESEFSTKIPGPQFPVKKTDEYLTEEEFEQQLNEIGEGNSKVFPTQIQRNKGGYLGIFKAGNPDGSDPIDYIVETRVLKLYQSYIDLVSYLLCPDDLEEREMCEMRLNATPPTMMAAYDILFYTEFGGYSETNRGQLFQIMATVVDFLKRVIQKEKPKDLLVYKFIGSGREGEDPGAHTQRSRIYMQYVKKHIVNTGFECHEYDDVIYLIKADLSM